MPHSWHFSHPQWKPHLYTCCHSRLAEVNAPELELALPFSRVHSLGSHPTQAQIAHRENFTCPTTQASASLAVPWASGRLASTRADLGSPTDSWQLGWQLCCNLLAPTSNPTWTHWLALDTASTCGQADIRKRINNSSASAWCCLHCQLNSADRGLAQAHPYSAIVLWIRAASHSVQPPIQPELAPS